MGEDHRVAFSQRLELYIYHHQLYLTRMLILYWVYINYEPPMSKSKLQREHESDLYTRITRRKTLGAYPLKILMEPVNVSSAGQLAGDSNVWPMWPRLLWIIIRNLKYRTRMLIIPHKRTTGQTRERQSRVLFSYQINSCYGFIKKSLRGWSWESQRLCSTEGNLPAYIPSC